MRPTERHFRGLCLYFARLPCRVPAREPKRPSDFDGELVTRRVPLLACYCAKCRAEGSANCRLSVCDSGCPVLRELARADTYEYSYVQALRGEPSGGVAPGRLQFVSVAESLFDRRHRPQWPAGGAARSHISMAPRRGNGIRRRPRLLQLRRECARDGAHTTFALVLCSVLRKAATLLGQTARADDEQTDVPSRPWTRYRLRGGWCGRRRPQPRAPLLHETNRIGNNHSIACPLLMCSRRHRRRFERPGPAGKAWHPGQSVP